MISNSKYICIAVFVFLTACNQEASNDPVLAKVNGDKIHKSELDSLIIGMFGSYQASTMTAESNKRALESLVASRALAQIAEDKIDAEKLKTVAQQVSRYRENLLINEYIKSTITPEPVTNEMIEQYYTEHQERFGKAVIRKYEMLTTAMVLPPELRDKLLQEMSNMKSMGLAMNLAAIKTAMAKKNIELLHHKGVAGESGMDSRIQRFIAAQPVNKRSDVMFVEGKPYIVNVESDITTPAKPLGMVREEVRKNLAMLKLGEVVKELSAKAVQEADVKYMP